MERKLLLSKQNKHMDKKKYIKPEIEVMAIEAESHMMTASPNTPPGFGEGEATDNEVLGNGRRGTWGNLWAEE